MEEACVEIASIENIVYVIIAEQSSQNQNVRM